MTDNIAEQVAAIRRFNRFYTRKIGALDEAHLGAPYSLAESRVLYEVAQAPSGATPKTIAGATGLDAGYLSRILKRFEQDGVMARATSKADGRSLLIRLTDDGRPAFEALKQVAEGAVENMIGHLAPDQRDRLAAAMGEVERLLSAPTPPTEISLRPHRVGDMGWVTWRHAVLYAHDYGWDERFEALVGRITADFIEGFEPARERCWIAERGGEIVGSIFLTKGDGEFAQLRLLLTEASVRGQGLGKRLVSECLGFARSTGYAGVTLWTQSILTAARGIYAAAGFELVESRPHRLIGVDLVGETWRLRF